MWLVKQNPNVNQVSYSMYLSFLGYTPWTCTHRRLTCSGEANRIYSNQAAPFASVTPHLRTYRSSNQAYPYFKTSSSVQVHGILQANDLY